MIQKPRLSSDRPKRGHAKPPERMVPRPKLGAPLSSRLPRAVIPRETVSQPAAVTSPTGNTYSTHSKGFIGELRCPPQLGPTCIQVEHWGVQVRALLAIWTLDQ